MSALEKSFVLEPLGVGEFRGMADPAYEADNGMFGGWTAALLMRAVVQGAEGQGSVSAINVSYLSRVVPGSLLRLRTQALGSSKSLSTWRAELFEEGGSVMLATANVVLAHRRASVAYTEMKMPEVPPPETVEDVRLPLKFGQRTEVRNVDGPNVFSRASTCSLVWEREMSGRAIDAVQLAYLADIGAPRVFYISSGPRPSATLTLSLYIHATPEELSQCGDSYVLSDMVGTRIESSTVGSKANMWSQGGALLATTEQLCWFR
jgi:acyl-CoA thioesterase